ncbi:hypothetical protein [Zunongwangia endophytica]|uniref:Uncharacterized protein n=1 Tax=Zunongwangia endophytica TaxID=1808945 RepID=A0ABV8H8U8_9FLAO|nr:hypothetical protein [Zunongwangia endophytica]MDN3595301.1 hypothetical protein [Zunongwangia endophytica]
MSKKIKGDNNLMAGRDIYQNFPEEDYGVIDTIFNYVLDKIKEGKSDKPSLTKDKLIHINEKIKLNFINKSERDEVRFYFTQLYLKINFVEKAFSTLNSQDQASIHYYIHSNYKKLKRQSLRPINILIDLPEIFVPKKYSKNPSFKSIAQGIVLFFFDDCTIFEKTSSEGQNDLFSEL